MGCFNSNRGRMQLGLSFVLRFGICLVRMGVQRFAFGFLSPHLLQLGQEPKVK